MKTIRYCNFVEKLYIAPSIRRLPVVKWKLQHGAGQLRIYLLTAAANPADQFDMLHCGMLKQPYFRDHPVLVYGIASSYRELQDIVLRISEEAAASGMAGKLREYLDRKEGLS